MTNSDVESKKVLVDCSEIYWEFVRELRNNPKTISGFLETNFISSEMQSEYMKSKNQYYKVCLLDGVPCGYIGIIDNDIRICTHPKWQRKGVALFMLENIMKIYPNVSGKVKHDNSKSKKLFLAAGFSESKITVDFIFYTNKKS